MDNYKRICDLYNTLTDDKKKMWDIFFTNDYPIPYKKLVFYPIKINMFFLFEYYVICLEIPQMTSGDIKAITMSYLQYIYYLIIEKNRKELAFMLTQLLLIALNKEDYYMVDGEKKETIVLDFKNNTLIIEDVVYNSKDFDIMRELILKQNNRDLPDETIDSDLLKEYLNMKDIEARNSKYKMCKLEDEINIVVGLTSYKRDEIFNLTIRSFSKLYERVVLIMHYKLLYSLTPYMDKKDKDTIIPFDADITKTLKEKIQESFSTLGDYQKKIK